MMDLQFRLLNNTYYDFNLVDDDNLDSKIKTLPKLKKIKISNDILIECLNKNDSLFLNKSNKILDFITCSIY